MVLKWKLKPVGATRLRGSSRPGLLSPHSYGFLRLRRQTSVEVRLVKRPRLDPEFWAAGKQLRKEDQFNAQLLINTLTGEVEIAPKTTCKVRRLIGSYCRVRELKDACGGSQGLVSPSESLCRLTQDFVITGQLFLVLPRQLPPATYLPEPLLGTLRPDQ
jgi:hypothetical protein